MQGALLLPFALLLCDFAPVANFRVSSRHKKTRRVAGCMSLGSFVIDLVCAQLHLPGSCRMMMMVHVVDANEHDERA